MPNGLPSKPSYGWCLLFIAGDDHKVEQQYFHIILCTYMPDVLVSGVFMSSMRKLSIVTDVNMGYVMESRYGV